MKSGRSYIYLVNAEQEPLSISSEALAASDIFKKRDVKMLTGIYRTDRMSDRDQSALDGQVPIGAGRITGAF